MQNGEMSKKCLTKVAIGLARSKGIGGGIATALGAAGRMRVAVNDSSDRKAPDASLRR